MNEHVRAPAGLFSAPVATPLLSYQSLKLFAGAVDALSIVLASVIGSSLYQYLLDGQDPQIDTTLGTGATAAAVFCLLSLYMRLHRIDVILAPATHLKQIAGVVCFSLLSLVCLMFLLRVGSEYSRGAFLMFGFFALATVPASRLALARLAAIGMKKRFIGGRRAIVIGEASELERLAPQELRRFGFEEVARIGLVHDQPGRGLGDMARARIAGATNLARSLRADEFVLLFPWGRNILISEVGELLRPSPLSVKLLPDATVRNVLSTQRHRGLSVPFDVELQREPLSQGERFAKRSIDIALSLAALIMLSPLLLITAIAIKLDSHGPLLFRQRRVGFDNREFVIFKFRSMTVLDDGAAIVQATRGDQRVTRVGKILRRSSIDELPQILNVLRGDMSLVGPRPHARAHHDQYSAIIAKYAFRHHVKPGLTGMAQVLGLRGETPQLEQMERRVEKDIWYINHWSLRLDLTIMARTCLALLRHEAY